MDHVAIMKKSWELIPKILDGRKKIESRWGKNKVAPWGKIKVGDTVYFKNSGEKITAKAVVYKVKQFEKLYPDKIREILERYGNDGGISVQNIEDTIRWAKEKRYCTLVYLKNPMTVKPFNINKKGFGIGCAWIVVNSINKLKMP